MKKGISPERVDESIVGGIIPVWNPKGKKMFRKLLVLAILVLLPYGAATAGAQEWDFKPQDLELTLGGSGSNDTEGDNTVISVEGSLGYFFTDAMLVGLRQGIGYADNRDNGNWRASTRAFLDFHFDVTGVRPFIGVNFGYFYGDVIKDTVVAGPEGGIKAYVTDSAFLYGVLEYNFTFEDAGKLDESFDSGRFGYAVGIGTRW
ncbi:MAG: hypothetical protein R6U50_18635 [Desulfobacterales bacterium]